MNMENDMVYKIAEAIAKYHAYADPRAMDEIEVILSTNMPTEKVCRECLKPYDAPSLCPICLDKYRQEGYHDGLEDGIAEGEG
jgi:recombinational DNA repair protein RecR